ncbi:methyl-accepting chemotaxis sensory transducer with Cache sensor [Sporobacter termitidis DSM 10068]|uniref:Methyl-accepting chemotaxis sensory transducer with Cache sensor n=1 Tax=Sporobacter termitidis DSM 10068 TaxID=1123282 RepID=A0A1M5U649_9FIRM|nr:methyl-accepting chemotaxis protein [Sporobacter termitidis]SHH58371.1 methyl-accepting chemotaxis sensory transducer with Cache sensor [Sporobacter termitidis DSM 10068]
MQTKSRKLSAKISAAMILLMIAGLCVVGFVSYLSASNAMTDLIENDLNNSAHSAATLMSTKITSMKTEAELIAAGSDMKSMSWAKQKPLVEALIKQMGYMSMAVADKTGNANFGNGTQADISERDYFKAAINGTTTVTDPILSKVDNKMVSVTAAPIKDAGDRIVGVLMIAHDASAITDMSNDIKVGNTGYSFIVNSAGVTIAHPDADKVVNADNIIEDAKQDAGLQQLADVVQTMISGASGYGTYTYDGAGKVIAYAPIPDTQWSIGLTAPKAEFFSGISALLYLTAGITVLFIAISVTATILVIKRIVVRPIKKLVDVSDRLALGDVDVNIEITSHDEIGALSTSFQQMIDTIRTQVRGVEEVAAGDLTVQIPVRSEHDILGIKLGELIEKNNEVLTNISTATDQVATGARAVSESSMTLSQGATEQASSLEQLTASIEDIASITHMNADNAGNANTLAERAKTTADVGKKQMQDMLYAMDGINASSGSISKIIKVIDDIAFQTNILALNAAVEAARAGQHGKGFAVVAEEVRSLAARSANAAKETTEMIESSIRKVEEGTKIANETAVSLNRIVDDIDKAAQLVGNIAASSVEQSTGISQINQALNQVNAVVQANTATSEESAAASEELSSQADFLRDQVKRFRLKGSFQGIRLEDAPIQLADKKGAALPARAVRYTDDSDYGKY